MESQPTQILPAIYLLFGLAVGSLIGVFSPRVRKLWHWGVTVESSPISSLGCLLVFGGFTVMGAAVGGLALGWLSASVAILVVLGGFVVFIVAGALDTWKAGRG